MAKPISQKTQIIREALAANAGMGLDSAAVASIINAEGKVHVKPSDVYAQRQTMKNVAGPLSDGPAVAVATTKPPGTVEVIGRLFALARDVGGIDELKRLVDVIAAG